MGQNKGISEMFKKPVLQFMALLKKKKKHRASTALKSIKLPKPLRLMHHKGIRLANIYVSN